MQAIYVVQKYCGKDTIKELQFVINGLILV